MLFTKATLLSLVALAAAAATHYAQPYLQQLTS